MLVSIFSTIFNQKHVFSTFVNIESPIDPLNKPVDHSLIKINSQNPFKKSKYIKNI